ncbi:MAG TPA: hypothetical protein VIJ08_03495 [Acidimicrobiales bacterium]
MAKSATGRWVSRVGASGGGKAYKKTRPGNFYGALVVIVVLGLVATVYARFEYEHPAKNPTGVAPKIGTTWYAALSIQACGKYLPYLSTDSIASHLGMYVLPANVIKIDPVSAADAGNNATLSQFADEYPGLLISSSQMNVPKNDGVANPATDFTNGQTCPSGKGDHYGGQTGKVTYAYWKSFGSKPIITTNPATIKFAPDIRIAMAFDPTGVKPMVPRTETDNAMVADATTVTSTTTVTTPPVTTTTVKGTTTTTTKSTTTTTPKG